MPAFIQNHPGQRDTRPRPVPGTNSQGLFSLLILLIAIPVAIAVPVLRRLYAIGKIEQWLMYALIVLLAVLSLVVLLALTKRMLYKNVAEQKKYYRVAGGLNSLPREKREALQLEAPFCYNVGQWVETLEYWPAAIRLPRHARFTTFLVTTVEERLAANDMAWGVLSERSYIERVETLFAGMHSRLFASDKYIIDTQKQHAMINRLAELTQLSDAYIHSCWEALEGKPALLVWAFDLQRVVELSRTSFMAGLITEQMAWEHILKASLYAHALFDNADAFFNNYRLGHAYWCDDFKKTNETTQLHKAYNKDCGWPITKLAWNKRETGLLPDVIQNSCKDYVQEAILKETPNPIGFRQGGMHNREDRQNNTGK